MSDIGLQYCKKHKAVVLPFMGKMPCCIQKEADLASAAVGEAMLVVESAEHKVGAMKEALWKYGVHGIECQKLGDTLQEGDLPYHTHLGPHRTQAVPAGKVKCVCGLNKALGVVDTTPCITHLIGRCDGCGYSYCLNCQTCGKCPEKKEEEER